MSANDVTEEYSDVAARVRALEASFSQLEKLMEKANDVEDV